MPNIERIRRLADEYDATSGIRDSFWRDARRRAVLQAIVNEATGLRWQASADLQRSHAPRGFMTKLLHGYRL